MSRLHRRREIEKLLSLRESEGLSLRALSEHSGIPTGTLSWWSHKLRSEAREAARELDPREPAFVELVPSDESPQSSAEMRIDLPSGATIEFRGEFAESVAERLVARLAPWS